MVRPGPEKSGTTAGGNGTRYPRAVRGPRSSPRPGLVGSDPGAGSAAGPGSRPAHIQGCRAGKPGPHCGPKCSLCPHSSRTALLGRDPQPELHSRTQVTPPRGCVSLDVHLWGALSYLRSHKSRGLSPRICKNEMKWGQFSSRAGQERNRQATFFSGPKTQGDFAIILFAVARTQAAGNHTFRGFYVSREY